MCDKKSTILHVVVLCEGRKPLRRHISAAVNESDLFIAADGGANTARELHLHPDVIIGDLDSYKPSRNDRSQVIKNNDQETNDLEKALSYALGRGASSVRVFGAIGKRLDHTLKNLSVLKQFQQQFSSLKFIDTYGEIFLLPGLYRATLPLGTTISLFPLSGSVEEISTKGLKYPLNNESLQNGVRDGSSNETVNEEIVITHRKGDLLLFIATNPNHH